MSTASSVPAGATSTPSGANAVPATAPSKFTGFTVPAILTWKDPAKTGALFGQAMLAWVVLSSSFALRLFLRLSFYLLLLLSALEFSTRLINGANNGLIASYRFSRFLPREQAIQNISASVAKNVRQALYGIEYVLDTRSPVLNVKLAFGAWVLYKILGIFTVSSLALIAIVATFILPVVYLQFKPQVDEAITQIHAYLHEQHKKLEKIAHDKAGPQIEFVQKLLNKRGRGGLSTGSATTPGHSGARSVPIATSTGTETTPVAPVAPVAPLSASSAPTHSAPTHSAPTHSAPTHSTPTHSISSFASSPAAAVPAADFTAPLKANNLPTTEEVLSTYDSVPSLAGDVKLDSFRVDQFKTDARTLRDSIKQDKPAH